MSWVKLDDGFADHAKILAAGADAVCLWVCGLAYCNRQPRRDGFIPAEKVGVLYPMRNAAKVARRLVNVGLWEQVDGGFFVHDYHDFQPSAEQVAALSAKRAAAGHAGGVASGEARRSAATDKQIAEGAEANCFRSNEAKMNPVPVPVPVPVPEPQNKNTHRGAPPTFRPTDVCPPGGIAPMAMRCDPDLAGTPGMLADLARVDCLDPVAEVRLYALTCFRSNRRQVDWTETGPEWPLWVHRHGNQMPCAAKQKAKATRPWTNPKTAGNAAAIAAFAAKGRKA